MTEKRLIDDTPYPGIMTEQTRDYLIDILCLIRELCRNTPKETNDLERIQKKATLLINGLPGVENE